MAVQNFPLNPFAASWIKTSVPPVPARRSIFVSYHHADDQTYCDLFSRLFSDTYSVIRDNSLREEIWSDDPEYIMRRIREEYLTGTSCTIVLCGRETPWRKFVDWEIKATLDKQHGLIGIALPSVLKSNGKVVVPHRFFDNFYSGFAHWLTWDQLLTDGRANTSALQQAVELANGRPKQLIKNDRQAMTRNGTRSSMG